MAVRVSGAAFSSLLKTRAALQFENVALRHQIGVLQRGTKRPKLTAADRLFWVALSRMWGGWRSALAIVQPETVIAWHHKGFQLFWTGKVRRGKPGRPAVPAEVRDLIRTMSRDNPLWGAPRIHGELRKLGIDIGETSVSKYMVRGRKPPSQTWRTFLENHVKSMVSVDFFTVPTIRFQILYVFLVLAHDRRRILHFAVTAHPNAEWTAQQLREAFPWDTAPRYLLRDRDRIFGREFVEQVKAMGIQQVLSAPRSPWQRGYVERARFACSQRRELVSPSPKVRGLLSSQPDAPGPTEGYARAAPDPATRCGTDHRDPGGGRTPSSLRALRGLTTHYFPRRCSRPTPCSRPALCSAHQLRSEGRTA